MKYSLYRLLMILAVVAMIHKPSRAQYILNGDAVNIGGTCYRLTHEATNLAGSVWYESLISLDEDFDINFGINLGDLDVNGADGIYFVLQPVSTGLGATGGGMGYEGISPSVGVEFDTYQNGIYGDPAYDHIAIQSDGVLDHASAYNLAAPVQIISGVDNAEDGMEHYVKITWDAASQTLSAYVDCDLRVSYTGDIVSDIFGGDPNVYFGFTAGTGALYNNQIVCFDYVPEVDTIPDVTICPGDSTQLTLPDGFTSYSWSPDYHLSDPTSNAPWASPDVTTTYVATITDMCGSEIYDTVTVYVVSPELVDLPDSLALCEGQSYTFNAYTPGAIYLWSNGSTGPTLTITAAGTYWVTVTSGACTDTDSSTVTYYPSPMIDLGPDTTVCGIGTPYVLDATTSGGSYLWQNGSTSPTFTVTTDGVYWVTVSVGGCNDKDTVHIDYTAKPIVDLGPDFLLCPGLSVDLNAGSPDLTYLWQDGSTSNTYTVTQPGTYWVTETVNGCSATDTLHVGPDPCICDVEVPDAFTPNNDGVNDVFKQVDCTFFTDFYMRIYNRWGQVVFETTNPNEGWDGTYKGKDEQMGTYVYYLYYERVTGETGTLQGNFLLIR